MTTEKRPEDLIGELLPAREFELLKRLAAADRRRMVEQILWLIDAYATGRLKDLGDAPATPRVRLDGLPEVHYPERMLIRKASRDE